MEYRKLSQDEYRDLESRIIYEDNHLFIVNKKTGEIVQSDKTGDECLIDAYKAFIAQRDAKPGKVYLGAAHRIDRPVCGICIMAKTTKALGRLSDMFRNGEIHKKYWALCYAAPQPRSGHLEQWLFRNVRQNKTYPVGDGSLPRPERFPDAKIARLNYRWLKATDHYHLIEVELLTGRHHQIRCQLASIDCIIKGDLKYGAPRSNPDGGICLQSHEISFIHPVRKTAMDFRIQAPESWKGITPDEI